MYPFTILFCVLFFMFLSTGLAFLDGLATPHVHSSGLSEEFTSEEEEEDALSLSLSLSFSLSPSSSSPLSFFLSSLPSSPFVAEHAYTLPASSHIRVCRFFCVSVVGILRYLPTTYGGMQKWKLSWNTSHIAYYMSFCTFGTDLYAQSVFCNKISASELSRKAY